MAAEGEVPERMLRAHRSGYDGFVWMMKWGAVLSFIVALIVIAIISN
jgi:di/tricarboxylate transporter